MAVKLRASSAQLAKDWCFENFGPSGKQWDHFFWYSQLPDHYYCVFTFKQAADESWFVLVHSAEIETAL